MSSVSERRTAGFASSAVPRLEKPAAVAGGRIDRPYAISFVVYHAVALLAVLPWLFSWTGLALCLLGTYVFGTLGINLCYHRLLTHRSFVCPRWLEHTFAILGEIGR